MSYNEFGLKKPGAKCDKLKQAFEAIFKGLPFGTRNSVGIYTPHEQFMCKRAVCFTEGHLRFCDFFPKMTQEAFSKPLIWGVCGEKATRANEAADTKFLLCFQRGKQFISRAIIHMNESSAVPTLDTNKERITALLVGMKQEMEEFSSKKSELRQQRQKPRKRRCSDAGSPCAKIPRVDSPVSVETSSNLDTDADTPIGEKVEDIPVNKTVQQVAVKHLSEPESPVGAESIIEQESIAGQESIAEQEAIVEPESLLGACLISEPSEIPETDFDSVELGSPFCQKQEDFCVHSDSCHEDDTFNRALGITDDYSSGCLLYDLFPEIRPYSVI